MWGVNPYTKSFGYQGCAFKSYEDDTNYEDFTLNVAKSSALLYGETQVLRIEIAHKSTYGSDYTVKVTIVKGTKDIVSYEKTFLSGGNYQYTIEAQSHRNSQKISANINDSDLDVDFSNEQDTHSSTQTSAHAE